MLTAALILASALAAQPDPAHELTSNVNRYLKTRKQALAPLPKLKSKSEPEQIAAHKRAAAEAIRNARPNDRQGDIFTPAVQSYLKQMVRTETDGKAGAPARKTVQQGNPAAEGTAQFPIRVNGLYPDSAPLSSVPPDILLRLPQLPKEVQFRFVGKNLILYDTGAGLIVDFIPEALP